VTCFRKRVTPETVPRGFIDVDAGQALSHVENSDLFSTHLWDGQATELNRPNAYHASCGREEVGSPEQQRERPKKWDRLADDGPTWAKTGTTLTGVEDGRWAAIPRDRDPAAAGLR